MISITVISYLPTIASFFFFPTMAICKARKKIDSQIVYEKTLTKSSVRFWLFIYTIVSVDDLIICAEPNDFIVNVTNKLVNIEHMYQA